MGSDVIGVIQVLGQVFAPPLPVPSPLPLLKPGSHLCRLYAAVFDVTVSPCSVTKNISRRVI